MKTMAAGMLPSLIKWAFGQLSTMTSFQPSSPNLPEQELSSLLKTMLKIQADLAEHAEQRDIRAESVKLRLTELKHLAYDAQDVFEEYEQEVLRAKVESRSATRRNDSQKGKLLEVSDQSFTHIPVPYYLVDKAREIIARYDAITSDWKALHLGEYGKRKREQPFTRQQTSSFVDESQIFGREEEKEKVIELLLANDDVGGSRGSISAIPVVGMGGIGKTALAQLVYNDPRVRRSFDLMGWICVSEGFDVEVLTRQILESFSERKVENIELDALRSKLQNELQEQKFLLVLDDIWNEDQSLWELLILPLLSARVGKIIVTTRSESIATLVKTVVDPVNLGILSFDNCWELFKKIALEGLDRSVQEKLVEIGRKIVEKCKGLPLAVKVLGHALRYEDDVLSWREILQSELWDLDEGISRILPALKLSYDCMPTELKRCFQYLSLFPKDAVLAKQIIVHLWKSQGLLRPSKSKEAEEVGSDCIQSLVQRSILQVCQSNQQDEDEKPFHSFLVKKEDETYIMHDLVNDLAQFVASDECLRVAANRKFQKDKVFKLKHIRHLSLVYTNKVEQIDLKSLQELKFLRTLIIESAKVLKWEDQLGVPSDLFSNLRYIRALDLSYTNINVLPDSVGNLKLLHYLSIKGNPIESLPQSICSLYNLQAMNVDGTQIKELPRGIGNLLNLHLLMVDPLVNLPRGIGQLTNLQTLESFRLGKSSSHCEIGELNGLQNLRGYLSIYNLPYVDKSYISRSETPLKTKNRLHTLVLSWDTNDYDDDDDGDDGMAEQLLERLRPHANLKELKVEFYTGVRLASWVGDASFCKLVHVALCNCWECSILPTLSKLPSLQTLTLVGMNGIEHIGREFCAGDGAAKGFPSLKTLQLSSMCGLTVWDGVEFGDFPSLLDLNISECPLMVSFPRCLLFSLKALRLNDLGSCSLDGGLTDAMVHRLSFDSSCGENPPRLEKLEIYDCRELRYVVGLTKLTSLRCLTIDQCPRLQIPQTERLPSTLKTLSITNSPLAEHWNQEQKMALELEWKENNFLGKRGKGTSESSIKKNAVTEPRGIHPWMHVRGRKWSWS
ncbi:disease resistance RPP13-like protein 1 [Canna indica]|uniref:Disease resistance RPP13-like protein 1 n=1 Tax=Canna indica TaxID=4628 RepID=A0AAQ3KHJ0_9LILI|nr:disease resistance RPP13-like protein 1 [Canna indica]